MKKENPNFIDQGFIANLIENGIDNVNFKVEFKELSPNACEVVFHEKETSKIYNASFGLSQKHGKVTATIIGYTVVFGLLQMGSHVISNTISSTRDELENVLKYQLISIENAQSSK